MGPGLANLLSNVRATGQPHRHDGWWIIAGLAVLVVVGLAVWL